MERTLGWHIPFKWSRNVRFRTVYADNLLLDYVGRLWLADYESNASSWCHFAVIFCSNSLATAGILTFRLSGYMTSNWYVTIWRIGINWLSSRKCQRDNYNQCNATFPWRWTHDGSREDEAEKLMET